MKREVSETLRLDSVSTIRRINTALSVVCWDGTSSDIVKREYMKILKSDINWLSLRVKQIENEINGE